MPSMYENYETELKITADKARALGMWFLNRNSGEWITPNHFELLGKAMRIEGPTGNRNIFTLYVMANPKAGINARLEKAIKAAAELQEFTQKVIDYYNFVEKSK